MTVSKIAILMPLFSSFLLFGGSSLELPKSEPIAVKDNTIEKAYYLRVGYSYYKHKNLSFDEKLSSSSIAFALGYSFSNYFACEFRYTQSKKIKYKSLDEYKLLDSKFYNLSLLTKLSYPIYNFKPYLLFGIGRNKITNLVDANRVEYSFEYGAGVEYKINKNLSVFADYLRVYNKKGFDGRAMQDRQRVTLMTTGIIYKF